MSQSRTTPLRAAERATELLKLSEGISDLVISALDKAMDELRPRVTTRAAAVIVLEAARKLQSYMEGALLAIAFPDLDTKPLPGEHFDEADLHRATQLILLQRYDSSSWAEAFFKARLDHELTFSKESPILTQILKHIPENPYVKR